MAYNPLTIGDVKKVLECLDFTLNRITGRSGFLVYTHPNSFKELFIPNEPKVISHSWLIRIVRRLEDFSISTEDMVRCGLLTED